jgi:predicted amidophosphoribosyltransferase
VRDAALDLFLGSRCAGCDRPGRMVCAACRAELPRQVRPAWPTPTPAGLVTPWAAAPYAGAVRSLVVGHKDRGQWGHRRLLGQLLAESVRAATRDLETSTVLLVPVPSRPGATRRRGYDPVGAVALAAARTLRSHLDVVVGRALVSRGGVVDQAGLGAESRGLNMAGSMHCPSALLRRIRRRVDRAHVVLCDDVITTGATLREAQRALTGVGLPPVAAAVVAATERRFSPVDAGAEDDSGLRSLSCGHPTR